MSWESPEVGHDLTEPGNSIENFCDKIFEKPKLI